MARLSSIMAMFTRCFAAGCIADAKAEVSAVLTDGAAAKLTASRWRAAKSAGKASAGRTHPAAAEILGELAVLEEAEAEAEEEAAVEKEQRRRRQGDPVEAEEVVTEVSCLS